MRKLYFLILALLLLAGPAAAYDVLILQSRPGDTYDDTVRGFQSVCATGSRVIVISEYAEIDLPRIIREDNPRVVVAVGERALAAARTIIRTPVVALKARTLHTVKLRKNVTGVRMTVSPEHYVHAFKELGLKKIGVVYNEVESGSFLNRSRSIVHNSDMGLLAKEIDRPSEVLEALSALKGKIDAVWLIPDRVVATRENGEAFFRFTLDQQVPLVTFSASHLGMGAAVAVDLDYFDVGRQGGEIARKLLQGASPADIPPVPPRKVNVKKNLQILKRLGFVVDPVMSSLQLPLATDSSPSLNAETPL